MGATPHVLDPESGRGRHRSRRAGSSTTPPGDMPRELGRILHLRVDPPAPEPAAAPGAMGLWDAWQALDSWERTADDELGPTLGELLLLLWSIHRLGSSAEGRAALDDLIDENMHPTFDDPVLEDVVGVSFALGAAWADHRRMHGGLT